MDPINNSQSLRDRIILIALIQAVMVANAKAQVVADSHAPVSQQPEVTAAANGTPLVTIQTPSAAGISRNSYQQFDIDTSSVILNNARTNTQTQLGGWIQGNPYLAQGSARVILNEVNSTHPSQLNGLIEVAGQKAEVVVANPAGISCNGCGFINAERTTLTTGTPLFIGENLEGYRVHGGAITIHGAGMDSSQSDYSALIARSVTVNAGLWAQQLQLITGAQQVSADHTTLQAIHSTSPAPDFALDVSALGGMYAHKIVLRGTEDGVGVRNAGTIGAHIGELIITTEGRLENSGQLLAADKLDVQVHALNNASGELYSDNTLTIHATTSVDNQNSLISSRNDLTISADEIRNATTNSTASSPSGIYSEQLHLKATTVDNNQGLIQAEQLLDIDTGYLNNDNGKLLSAGDLSLSLKNDVVNNGDIYAKSRSTIFSNSVLYNHGNIQANELYIQTQQLDNFLSGILNGHQTTVNVDETLKNYGLIDGKDTHIQAATLDNIGAGRIYGDRLSIAVSALYNRAEANHAPVLAARESLAIGADTVVNRDQALIFSAGTGNNALTIGGYLNTRRQALGYAASIHNESAAIESMGDLAINSQLLENNNLHFLTELVQVAGPQHYLYIQPRGSNDKQIKDNYRKESWSHTWRYRHKTTGDIIYNWTQFDVLQTDYETKVVTSAPALIRAEGDIHLSGQTLINNKSQIITGGLLQGNIDNLQNIDGLGQHIIHQEGASQYTQRHWRGGRKRYTERDWYKKILYTPADTIETINLNIVKTAQQEQNNNSNYNVAGQKSFYQVDNIRTIEIPIAIPTNHLFHSNTTSGYWIETDPRFTDYQQWLSSDHMLDQLNIDANTLHKRLGDGFYEQQLIREQIGQLTGRRFLDGYSNDEAQYRALLDAGSSVAKAWNLCPGVALSAEQMAQLSSDIVWLVERQIILPDGTETVALVPQVYVRLQAGDLDGQGALLAANKINLNVQENSVNSGTIAGRRVVEINSENLLNIGGSIHADNVKLSANRDIENSGGTIHANNNLSLDAGADVIINSTTHSDEKQAGSSDFSRTHLDRIADLYVNQGTLQINAGQDVVANGATIDNQHGTTTIDAGRDLNLGTVNIAEHENNVADANNYLRQGYQQDIGTTLQTQGDIQLHAGRNLTTTAATVRSEQGTIQATAHGDITIQSGQGSDYLDEAHRYKDRNVLGSKLTTTHDNFEENYALGSTFSGNHINIQAENIQVVGSNIIADTDTTLAAKNNLDITAATETHSENHSKEITRKGVLHNGGAALTLGRQRQRLDTQEISTSAAASTIGSIQGDIYLSAGNKYQQTGSDVIAAQGDITIQADAVEIVEARETTRSKQDYTFNQSGITLGLSSPVVAAVQTGQRMTRAASKISDTWTRAMAATVAGLSAFDAREAIKENPKTGGGVNVAITYGKSESHSTSQAEQHTTAGSTIIAGGDVQIRSDDDITVRGSTITADGNALLKAAGDINLLATQNTVATSQRSRNSSNGAGVAISVGENGAALGGTANINYSKGEGDAYDTVWNTTTITAGKQLNLESGANTTLRGATARANQVIATVGGDLNLESLQDTSTFHSKNSSIGGSLTVGNGVSGSANRSHQNISSNYANVTERTGIHAGDAGFQIYVNGHTDLKGAVIASTDKAITDGSNHLETTTMSTEDIENYAHARVESTGFGFSSDWIEQGRRGASKVFIQNIVLNNNSIGEYSIGNTRTAISDGTIIIRDKTGQNSTGVTADALIASLNRNTSNSHHVVQHIDTSRLEENIFAKQAIRTEFVNGLFQRIDNDSYPTSFSQEHDKYNPANGYKLTAEEKYAFQSSTESVRVALNGIFNDTDDAAKYAKQHNTDNSSPSYMLVFPKARTFTGKLLIASYQKFLEGNMGFGLTNSTKEVVNIIKTNGQTGLVFDAHSRGSMTLGNAMKYLLSEGDNNVMSNTDINLYGPAFNAQNMANMLNVLSNREKDQISLQNHNNDLVGRVIGGNPATHSTRPEGSNSFLEWVKIKYAKESVHNCYGGAGSDCNANYRTAETLIIKANRNENEIK